MKNQKGVTLLNVIIIVALFALSIFLINLKSTEYDMDGKAIDGDDAYEYLLNHKPSPEKISAATTIDYRSLYKGANTLNGNYYKIIGEVVQVIGDDFCHINMTKSGEYYSYYTDRIQISIIGTPSEILMEGDIVSFVGESLGNYTYITALGSESTIPFLRVYAENLQVIGNTD